MLSKRLLRGAVAYRQIVVPRTLKSTPWLLQNRFYTSDNASGNAGANNGANNAKTENSGTNGNAKAEKPTNGKPEETSEQVIEKLKKDLEEAKHEILLAIADRQNSIRIAKDDVRKAKEYGIQKFATSLFEVNDILERALDSVAEDKLANNVDLKNFHEGVKMTERLMLKVYDQNDLKRFSPMGDKFDPARHQALQEVMDPSKEAGTVCYVMKPGYMLKDRLLRPASVAVVKAEPKKEEPKKEESASS